MFEASASASDSGSSPSADAGVVDQAARRAVVHDRDGEHRRAVRAGRPGSRRARAASPSGDGPRRVRPPWRAAGRAPASSRRSRRGTAPRATPSRAATSRRRAGRASRRSRPRRARAAARVRPVRGRRPRSGPPRSGGRRARRCSRSGCRDARSPSAARRSARCLHSAAQVAKNVMRVSSETFASVAVRRVQVGRRDAARGGLGPQLLLVGRQHVGRDRLPVGDDRRAAALGVVGHRHEPVDLAHDRAARSCASAAGAAAGAA